MTTSHESFGVQAKALREQLDLTQMQVAVLLGVTPSQVSRWESEAQVPRPLTQEAILKRLRDETKKKKPKA